MNDSQYQIVACDYCKQRNRLIAEGRRNFCGRCGRPLTTDGEAYAMPTYQAQMTRAAPQVPAGPSALAATFAADAHELVRMGVRLDKGATLAEGAGLGAAAAAAFGGHWLLAAGAAIVGALASAGAQYYKQKKIDQMREKWRYVLSSFDDDGLRQFVLEVRSFYPQISAALSANTLGNYGTQHLLTWGK